MKRILPLALILAPLLAACGAPENAIEGVTSENYPRIDGYCAVSRADIAGDAAVSGVINWLTGEEGQARLARLGYIT